MSKWSLVALALAGVIAGMTLLSLRVAGRRAPSSDRAERGSPDAGRPAAEEPDTPARRALRRALSRISRAEAIDQETLDMLRETGLEPEHLLAWREMQERLAAYRDPRQRNERRREVAERLAARLEAEPTDVAWRDEIARLFSAAGAAFAGADQVRLAAVDCGETLCAMHLQWEDAAAKERLYPLLRGIGLAARSDAFVYDDPARERTLVYVGRPDTPLQGLL